MYVALKTTCDMYFLCSIYNNHGIVATPAVVPH